LNWSFWLRYYYSYYCLLRWLFCFSIYYIKYFTNCEQVKFQYSKRRRKTYFWTYQIILHFLSFISVKYYILVKTLLRYIDLTLSRYLWLVIQEKDWIKYRNLSRNKYRYLGCGLSLKAYSQIDDVTLDNNLDLNLYIILYLLSSICSYNFG